MITDLMTKVAGATTEADATAKTSNVAMEGQPAAPASEITKVAEWFAISAVNASKSTAQTASIEDEVDSPTTAGWLRPPRASAVILKQKADAATTELATESGNTLWHDAILPPDTKQYPDTDGVSLLSVLRASGGGRNAQTKDASADNWKEHPIQESSRATLPSTLTSLLSASAAKASISGDTAVDSSMQASDVDALLVDI